MRPRADGGHAATRLFAVYAAASLVPILVLEFVLVGAYRHEAKSRGLAEARSKANLIAQVLVEPHLGSGPVSTGITPERLQALDNATRRAIDSGEVVRLRLRDETGRVTLSDDGSGFADAPDDEVGEAIAGETVSILTRLNSDANDSGPAGERVVEVYLPLKSTGKTVGVLELYLPYEPIERDVLAGMTTLSWYLALGLLALWAVLGVISASVTRRLRREVETNTYLAHHDVLTGLPNRVLFHKRATAALERGRSTGSQVVIALLDLDRFKDVNDSLGHHNGDILLAELGRRLAGQVRGKDLVARLGGDEFGVILTDIDDAAHAMGILQRMRRSLEDEVQLRGLPLSVEASIGFSLSPADGQTVEQLMQRADVAMYVAKKDHAGTLHYAAADDQYDATKLALVAELRRAIDSDELILHYQPKVDAGTNRVCAAEALIRWNHPTRGLLFPDEFVPIAEQTGLIEPLTRWVIGEALAQIARWGDLADDLVVAVNVSARDLVRADFAASVLTMLHASGVAPRRLVLEITETALMTDPERAAETVRCLSIAGVQVSLDDFGRGQTSLGYLSTLALHELKIDKGFVLGMHSSAADAAIVVSMIELGHNLGLVVVAEGVETEEASSHLTGLGCDILQGYVFARPIPPEDFLAWLGSQPVVASR